jgi:lipopolysaccharide export system protein LptA
VNAGRTPWVAIAAAVGTVAAVAVAGCITAGPETPRLDHVELEGVAVEAEGVRLSMASATLEKDGTGTGEAVRGARDGRPPLEIDAPRTNWDLKARSAVFEGGVTAKRGEFTLTCDTLTVTFASRDRTDAVELAIAEGNVAISRDERTATGKRAELHGATGEVVLTGNPTLVEGSNRLTGEVVRLFLDDERISCEKCHLVIDGSAIGSGSR